MAEPPARLYLITPLLDDVAAFAPRLAEACGARRVDAVLARFAGADERGLVNRIKALAPAAQDHGAALVIAADSAVGDLVTIATRAGADGVHVSGDFARLRDLRERLKGERALGVGGLRTKDEAMTAGEAGADYLLLGEPRADGSLPSLESVIDRAAWWAEIFETPCAAYAPRLEDVPALAATNAEFIALGEAVWSHAEGSAAAVQKAIEALGAAAETAR
jgi:thiamine-phosphate pyrophosphorylase